MWPATVGLLLILAVVFSVGLMSARTPPARPKSDNAKKSANREASDSPEFDSGIPPLNNTKLSTSAMEQAGAGRGTQKNKQYELN
jgi:hypothetical protein